MFHPKLDKMRKTGKPVTHDYRERFWGHDYTLQEFLDGGHIVKAMGWGYGLENGDYFIIQPKNHQGICRYKVADVKYMRDPRDMWSVTLHWDQFDSEEQMLAEEKDWV